MQNSRSIQLLERLLYRIRLLKNRGLRNYDVNAEDSDAPDAGDVTMLKKIILGAESAENRIADVNNDNAVNVLDLIRVKRLLLFFKNA